MEKLFQYKIEDGKVCITKYLGSSKEVVIPKEIDGYVVKSIGNYAFKDNNLVSIDLSNVESIGNYSFENNNLTSINLSNVKSIGYYAFMNNNLISVDLFAYGESGEFLWSGIKKISDGAFLNNKLSAFGQPVEFILSGVENIGSFAFCNNKLTSINLSGVKSINICAFYNNKLTSIDLSSVESIGDNAFMNNNLEAIVLPNKFRESTDWIFDFNINELDDRNRKYVKKYVDKMRKLYMKKLYKNSKKYGLIFEYITYYTYNESYSDMLEEAVALKNID